MSVRLADRSFQYPFGIAENMLVEVGKFTFPADIVMLKMEEDSKVPPILGRSFLYTVDAIIRVKQKQLNLGVGTERMIFNIDSAMKHSCSNDDTCFDMDVIDEILEEDFNALPDEADLGASINLMPYSLYAKLSLKTHKPTKMSVRLADRSFQYPVGIAENMLVEVGKFTFPADIVMLEMEEDSKVPPILGRPFLYTVDAIIRVKQKQLNLGVRTERMIFNIDSAMKHSCSNDDTCFGMDVIDEILEEDFNALPDEDPPFEKITINTNYKIKTSLEEPPDLELKPLPNNLEYVFLEEPFF
nr:reverse transcriptase domain-containing protein [Tanacetum cinerariifolium]